MGYELGYEAPEELNELDKQGELPQAEPVETAEAPNMQEAQETSEPIEPAADGTGEGGEALGYSSEYWKHQMEGAAVSNLGRFTVNGEMTMWGNWSNNTGAITVAKGGSLLVKGGTGWNNYGEITVESGGRLETCGQINHNSGGLTVRTGGTLHNLGIIQGMASVTAEAGAQLVNDGVVNYAEGSLKLMEGTVGGTGHLAAGIVLDNWYETGVRVRWVYDEAELRAALADNSVDLVVWNSLPGVVALKDGPLIMNKGLAVFGGGLDFETGGLRVSGKDAFLMSAGCYLELSNSDVTVENGGVLVASTTVGLNDSRVEVSSGGMVCFGDVTAAANSEFVLSDGGRMVHVCDLSLNGCTLQIDEGGELCANISLDLQNCAVANRGRIRCLTDAVWQQGTSFIGNPIETD